jgi:hypothetical protein
MSINEKFLNSVKRGTGATYLYIKENPEVDFSEEIIKAALKNYAYDAQCEGSRAEYVYGLIQLSGNQEKIRKAILKGLMREKKDTSNLVQLFDLATKYAKEGDAEAKALIYKRYRKDIIFGSDWVGQYNIVELDGVNGFLYVADVIGKELLADPENIVDYFFVDFVCEEYHIDAYKELEKAGAGNIYIKEYLEHILRNKENSGSGQGRKKVTYELLNERILSGRISPLNSFEANELSPEDIKRLADDFLKAESRKLKEKYLRVFSKVKYPYDFHDLLNLAKKRYLKSDRMVEYAAKSLKYFKAKEIRDFVMKVLPVAKYPDDYTPLLVSNYEEGDAVLLERLVHDSKDQDTLHRLVNSYIDIYRSNKIPESKGPLTAFYRYMTCGIHRYDIVKIMHENGVLPERIKQEILYDSFDDTREFGQSII